MKSTRIVQIFIILYENYKPLETLDSITTTIQNLI